MQASMDELLIATSPDPDSRLRYLLRLPLAGGMVFRTSGTWPRTKALYCYPVDPDQWPDDPYVVERAPIRSCVRRGAAIDLVLDRGRENRSQIVFTTARGRDAVFWQSPRTRKQARPNISTPSARAAIVVEDRYSQIFKLSWVRPALVADGLAELQVRWPGVPIVFCETRQLAEEWTYRYLAAARSWVSTEHAFADRLGTTLDGDDATAAEAPEPTAAELRAWARENGLDVPDRGRLRPEIRQAWHDAHTQ
jgi:hypothetical protein